MGGYRDVIEHVCSPLPTPFYPGTVTKNLKTVTPKLKASSGRVHAPGTAPRGIQGATSRLKGHVTASRGPVQADTLSIFDFQYEKERTITPASAPMQWRRATGQGGGGS